ncbi:HdeD family acid-resistance protein [Lapidilactobacillus wuchangensis]|uniref:HdeD family acid-resistance protein n=1 Tax=Lapidilactobacillus wuchangensis TaxID=2486001 RepID=UPI000F7B6201|nr:DUF308 domain-containing protein [Lapidilactobacillus wuchangensis]
MDNLVKNIKRNMWLRGLVFILFGLLVAIKPNLMINLVIKLSAGFLLVMGIINFVSGIREKNSGESMNGGMIVGIIEAVAAIFVWIFARALLNMIPFVLGIILLVHGINFLIQVHGHRKYVNVSTLPSYIYGILILIAAIVMIVNPFSSVIILFRVFGWLLVVMGLIEIFGTRIFN